MISSELMGVVLCGGQSSRMGSDKALITTNKQTWVERSIQLLELLNIPVTLSANVQQRADYHKHFSFLNIICDDAGIDVKGPLLGLLSVHKIYRYKDLFVLACDLPLMNLKVMTELCNQYEAQPNKHAHVFLNDDKYEPLCSIYTSAGLEQIVRLSEQGGLQKFSMKYVIKTLDAATYPLPEEWKDYFINVNTQEDLHNLQLKR